VLDQKLQVPLDPEDPRVLDISVPTVCVEGFSIILLFVHGGRQHLLAPSLYLPKKKSSPDPIALAVKAWGDSVDPVGHRCFLQSHLSNLMAHLELYV
jgi:hypothetical protein